MIDRRPAVRNRTQRLDILGGYLPRIIIISPSSHLGGSVFVLLVDVERDEFRRVRAGITRGSL
jgi:hypothetical protein